MLLYSDLPFSFSNLALYSVCDREELNVRAKKNDEEVAKPKDQKKKSQNPKVIWLDLKP